MLTKISKPLDVGVLFAVERAELVRWFDRMVAALDTAGRLWVAWPKKASKVPTDIDFDFAQGIGLDAAWSTTRRVHHRRVPGLAVRLPREGSPEALSVHPHRQASLRRGCSEWFTSPA